MNTYPRTSPSKICILPIRSFLGQKTEVDRDTKALIDKNRGNHFRFNDGSTSVPLTSVSNSQYDYKGKAADIRSMLDEGKKVDLKSTHFQMGSHGNEYVTTSLHKNP